MAALATCDDVPIRIGKRHAVLKVGDGGVLGLNYTNTKCVPIHTSAVKHVVVGSCMIGIVFNEPFQLGRPPAAPVCSVVITNGSTSSTAWLRVLESLVSAPYSIDTRKAPFISTACSRSSVQIPQKGTVVVWHANTRCTVALGIYTVIMQRTKGGMATYDIHALCSGDEHPVTVEMLPHTTLDTWETIFGADKVYDFGADPIPARLLSLMYRECDRSWAEVMSEVRRAEGGAPCTDDESSCSSGSDSEWSQQGQCTSSDDSMSEAEAFSDDTSEACSDDEEHD